MFKLINKVPSAIWAVIFINISLTQTGCSTVPNTLAGLATPQSTISGSNYVFYVDPDTRHLKTEPREDWNSNLIRAGEAFVISLDSGFLRYLQAVDPYVIIYSEAWMESKPKPTDPNEIHRQVVLIKDGLSHNANLPLSSIPLLGPVTLGDGNHGVHVTLKIAVLSKSDNTQTIQLLNSAAGIVSSVAPVYGPAAGAAAEIGAAIVAQNKDKIEFEHSFTFFPQSSNNSTKSHFSNAKLNEAQIVVVKGENESRVVPYPHWGYYAWPFNWFGKNTDTYSRRYEHQEGQNEIVLINIIWETVRLPFVIIKTLFVPMESASSGRVSTFPDELELTGQFLFCIDKEMSEDETKAEIQKGTKDSTWWLVSFGKAVLNEAPEIFYGSDRSCPHFWPYTEKTFMSFSIRKTDGSLGSFDELVKGLSKHGEAVNNLTTSSSDSNELLTANLTSGLKSVQEAMSFDRAKRRVREKARNGIVDTNNTFPELQITDPEARKEANKFLVNLSIRENVFYTTERFILFAKSYSNGFETGNPDTQAKPNGEIPIKAVIEEQSIPVTEETDSDKEIAAKLAEFFPEILVPHIDQFAWKIEANSCDKDQWILGWKTVLENVRAKVFEKGRPEVIKGFSPEKWQKVVDKFESISTPSNNCNGQTLEMQAQGNS